MTRLPAPRRTILDTRKTAPGLRVLDKWAVRCGGATNHRLDLSDGVLIKNNHIALAGGVVPALQHALRNRRGSQLIEIEVRSLDELKVVLENGAEAVLLDNMSPEAGSQGGGAGFPAWTAAFRWRLRVASLWRMCAPMRRPA